MDASVNIARADTLFRSIYENTHLGIVILSSVQLTIVNSNPAACACFGYAEDELQGLSFESLIYPEDKERVCLDLANVLKNQSKNATLKNRCLTKSGDLLWVKFDLSVFKDSGADDQLLCLTIHSAVRDDDNNRSHSRNDSLDELSVKSFVVDESLNGIALGDLSGTITFVNKAFLQMWQYADAQAVLGKSAFDFWKSPDEARTVVRVILEHDVWEGELVAILGNGSEATFQVSAKLLRDNSGKPFALMSSFIDITERNKAELALRESEKRLSLIFNNTTDALILFRVEPNNRFICESLNTKTVSSLKALFPNTSVDIVGRERVDYLSDFGYPLNQVERDLRYYRQAVETKRRVIYETEIKTSNHTFYLQVIINPVFDHTGNCTHLLWNGRDITDQKKAERSLLLSEQKLSLIFNNTTDVMVLLRVEPEESFIIEAANNTFFASMKMMFPGMSMNIIGYDRKKLFLELGVPMQSIERELPYYRAAITNKQEVHFESELLQSSIETVHIDVTIKPIINEHGVCTHVLWNSRDITKRKNTEVALKESEERLRLALNAVNQGIYDVNLITGEGKVTEEYATILGYNPSEFKETFEFWLSRLHPEDAEAAAKKVYDYLNGVIDEYRNEFRTRTKSGEWKWILSVGKIVERDGNGNPTRLLGTHTDIDAQKKNEQLLKKSNQELQEIIDALDRSSLVSVTDKVGTILKVNKRFCEVARYTEDELIGKDHRITNSNYHSTDFWKELWETIISGKVWRGEIKNKAKDGTEYWVDTVINPIRDEHGEIKQFLAIRQDITDRKVYETLLLQSNLRLGQIEQFVDLTTDAMQVSDEDGRLVYINRAASERLGIPQNECTYYRIGDFNSFFRDENNWRTHIDSLKEAKTLVIEGWNTNVKTGQIYPVEIITQYVKIQNNGYRIAIARDISERKKNELVLKENKERLAEAQQMANLGYWELDLLSYKVWWSDEQYKINGIVKSEIPITQEVFLNLIHPEDRIWFMEEMNNLLISGNDITATYRIIRPDGELRIIQGKAHVSYNEYGQPVKLSGVNQDITERKMAEKALRESEETLLKAQRVAKIGSWKLDVRNNKLEWSDEAYKIFGVSPNRKLTYEDFLSFVHPEDKEFVESSWIASLKGKPYDIVHRILVGNTIKWVREQAELTFDELNKLTYGFGTVQDITDQKALQEANLIFNQSQLLTGLGSWRWSLKSNDVFWSDSIYQMFGVKKENNQLKFTLDYFINSIHPHDRNEMTLAIKQIIHNRKPFDIQFRIDTADQSERWFSSKGNVLCDNGGDPIEVYGIIREITEEKKRTEEIIEARKQAEEAASIKDEFLSIMSHEIRTPLNSVIGLTNLLLKRGARADQAEIMKTLKGSADNLLHLVNDILDFNKIRAGKVELENLPFGLSKFLQQLHSSFKEIAFEKGLTLSIQIDTRIPEILVSDVTRLNQIFNNLLSNAIKFTHKGQIKFQTDLKSRTDTECIVLFKIEDTGIGIAPDKLSLIFNPFNQSDKEITRKYGGTGLGLSIVKSLVDILGGKLGVNSVQDIGTVFTVELTFGIAQLSNTLHVSNNTLSHIKQNTNPSHSLNGLSILYVEDVESNRFLMENLFADNQINCISVSSGNAALRLTKTKKFDLILMDIQMPVMDGYETTSKIRAQEDGKNNGTPILAFTAEPYSDQLKKTVVKFGIQDVISKPFEVELLFRKFAQNLVKKPKREKFYSFTFYEKVFDNDSKKLRKIKRTVINDLLRFERGLELYSDAKKVKQLKKEIHRVRPIIKSLACVSLIKVLDNLPEELNNESAFRKQIRLTNKLVKNLIERLYKLDY